MGAYHGEHSFHTFSHKKSVLKQTNRFDFKFRYPSKNGLGILKADEAVALTKVLLT